MKTRNPLILFVLIAGLALLQACAAVGIQTNAQRIATACAGASASIDLLTVANGMGKLSEAQQVAILNAIGVVAPICAADTPPTLDDVKQQAFVAAIAGLQLAAAQAAAGDKP